MSPLVCSFCTKTRNQVDKLIAGAEAYICNECVELCREIIDAELGSTVQAPPSDDKSPRARAVRLPVHLVESANRIARAERKLIPELGREPTAAEIGHATGIDPNDVESIKGRIRN